MIRWPFVRHDDNQEERVFVGGCYGVAHFPHSRATSRRVTGRHVQLSG